ncbi:hypothetical protein LIER_16221 [Lithospermum erythrorhizon]|uniref:Reverse transcriptase domain-containing protein n=1 Tax=Lithospermum erythrorhizon TaxID=34254 RepID=A0AAV3Q8E1_LITER
MLGVDPVVEVHRGRHREDCVRNGVCHLLLGIDGLCLKNTWATYQLMVNKVLSTQIGRNMEIYVDDMLIKSWDVEDHEANLRESFENVRRKNLKLNANKWVFGVTSGKFLVYMIIQRGIEPNPDKITAIQAM